MDRKERMQLLRTAPELFREGSFGLEKENLRITSEGELMMTPHPVEKGEPLYERIIRDFGESQVELVSRPYGTPMEALEEIRQLQDYLTDEKDVRLWPFSMPCRIENASDIQVAQMDQSTEEGVEAVKYREALAERHGKKMQMISGIHYNFSFGDALFEKLGESRNTAYFHVARNLLRYQWLFTYLFGASPVVDRTYKGDVTAELMRIESCCKCCSSAHSYYEEYATSLRMSRYGYHSKRQTEMEVSYNDLEGYVESIFNGIKSDRLLKESEYYAPIRFKQTKKTSGNVIGDLLLHGVEYIELRMFDLSPYDPYGIEPFMLYFTHLMLIYALIQDSLKMDKAAMDETCENGQRTALFGRMRDKKIIWDGKEQRIKDVGEKLANELMDIAIILDEGRLDGPYSQSVTTALERLWHEEALPSERIMRELMDNGMSFRTMGVAYSQKASFKAVEDNERMEVIV